MTSEERIIVGRSGRYRLLEDISLGGESIIFACERGGERFVAKVFRHNYGIAPWILDALVADSGYFAQHHLIPCIDTGYIDSSLIQWTANSTKLQFIIHPYYSRGDMLIAVNQQAINSAITEKGDGAADLSRINIAAFEKLLAQLLDAISTLHSYRTGEHITGFIHRDIKPGNIFVDDEGNYVLADFGLVSAALASTVGFTQTKGITYAYAPPEAHFTGSAVVSREYDYFSLGMTLLHILTGRSYFSDNMSIDDIRKTVVSSTIEIYPSLPKRVRSLLRGLTNGGRKERFAEPEVKSWLEGNNPIPKGTTYKDHDAVSFTINNITYAGEDEVAKAMLHNWVFLREMIESGNQRYVAQLFRWTKAQPAEYVQTLVNLGKNDSEIGLQSLILRISTNLGYVWRGKQFESDVELADAFRRAALERASKEHDDLLAFLTKGGLRNAFKILTSDMDEAYRVDTEKTIDRLTNMAMQKPVAAMLLAGTYLHVSGGQPAALPPLTWKAPSGALLRFADVKAIQQWIIGEVAKSANAYADAVRACGTSVQGILPGEYKLGNVDCLLRPDGTKLARITASQPEQHRKIVGRQANNQHALSWGVPFSEDLRVFIDQMARSNLDTVTDLDDHLYAMLHSENLIKADLNLASDKSRTSKAASTQSEHFLSGKLLRFLSLFKGFRAGEQEPMSALRTIVSSLEARLRLTDALKIPISSQSASVSDIPGSVTFSLNRITECISSHSRQLNFDGFAQIVGVANSMLETMAPLYEHNYQTEVRLLSVYMQILKQAPGQTAQFHAHLEELTEQRFTHAHFDRIGQILNDYERQFSIGHTERPKELATSREVWFVRNYTSYFSKQRVFPAVPANGNTGELSASINKALAEVGNPLINIITASGDQPKKLDSKILSYFTASSKAPANSPFQAFGEQAVKQASSLNIMLRFHVGSLLLLFPALIAAIWGLRGTATSGDWVLLAGLLCYTVVAGVLLNRTWRALPDSSFKLYSSEQVRRLQQLYEQAAASIVLKQNQQELHQQMIIQYATLSRVGRVLQGMAAPAAWYTIMLLLSGAWLATEPIAVLMQLTAGAALTILAFLLYTAVTVHGMEGVLSKSQVRVAWVATALGVMTVVALRWTGYYGIMEYGQQAVDILATICSIAAVAICVSQVVSAANAFNRRNVG